MSLLRFCALTMVVPLLSMQGQKALGFHLNLCSKNERRSYRFGTTWGWVINDRIFIFGWTIPLTPGYSRGIVPILYAFRWNNHQGNIAWLCLKWEKHKLWSWLKSALSDSELNLLERLQTLVERVLPESQCAFRSERSTMDMIFSLRQLQEKCREQQMPLYIILTKAFDLVRRNGLFNILLKIGCPQGCTAWSDNFMMTWRQPSSIKTALQNPLMSKAVWSKAASLLLPCLTFIFPCS